MKNARLRHPCLEPDCTEEGLFGENVCLLKGELGTWRCYAHWKAHLARQPDPQIPIVQNSELLL